MNKKGKPHKPIGTIMITVKSLGCRFVYPVAKVKVIIESTLNRSDGVVRNDSM